MSEWNAWFNLNKIKNKKRSFISIGIFPLEILHLHSSLHSLRFIQLQMKCKEVEQVRELNERKEGRNGGVLCSISFHSRAHLFPLVMKGKERTQHKSTVNKRRKRSDEREECVLHSLRSFITILFFHHSLHSLPTTEDD